MYRRTAIPFVIFFLACSSRQPVRSANSAEAPPPALGATSEWERAFANARTPEERGQAAVMLVRQGASDAKYWDYIAGDARIALQQEEKASIAWKRSSTTEEYATAVASATHAEPWGQTNATSKAMTSSGSALRNNPTTVGVYSQSSSFNPADRPPDARFIGPIIRLSVTGDSRGAAMLHDALKSDNVLMASQAALGLAKLHDTSAIEEIDAAARKFPDAKLMFAQALVYFANGSADNAASRLIDDDGMLRDLKKVAQDNSYDPFPIRDQ